MPPRGPDAKTTSYMLTDPDLETWDFIYLFIYDLAFFYDLTFLETYFGALDSHGGLRI